MRRRSARGPGVTTTPTTTKRAGASPSSWRHDRRILRAIRPARGVRGSLLGATGLLLFVARRSALLMADLSLRTLLPPPRARKARASVIRSARAVAGWKRASGARARPNGENVDKKREPREEPWLRRRTTS